MTIVIELVKELIDMFDLTPREAMNCLQNVMRMHDMNMIEAQEYLKEVLPDLKYKIKK